MPGGYEFSPSSVPVLLAGGLSLAFGADALVRRLSRVSAAFFAMTLGIAIWMGAHAGMYLAADPALALRWARAAYVAVPFLAPSAYWFTLEILRLAHRRRVAHVTGWCVAAFFGAIAVTTDLLIPKTESFWWGHYPRFDPVVGSAFLVFFCGYLGASLMEFARARTEKRVTERRRNGLLLAAFVVACLGAIDLLPKFGVPVYAAGYIPVLACVVLVWKVVLQYEPGSLTPDLAAPEIIRTMADPLFVCDAGGRIQFANRAAAELLGYHESDLAGRPIGDILVRDQSLTRKLGRRSLRGGEYVFLTRESEEIELTLSIAPVVNEGDVVGAVIIGRDMRERKRAERDILQAVTLLQSTLDSTADGILVIGEGAKIVSYNQRFMELWGIPQAVMMRGDDRGVLQFMLAQVESPAEFHEPFETLAGRHDAESFDLVELRDGRRFERYSIGRHIDGVTSIRVWSFREVTERFEAEARLRESENRYRVLFEQNAAGVCVTSLEGTIIDCNAAFAALLDSDRDSIIGQPVSRIHANPGEPEEIALLLRSAGTLHSVEVELRRPDGRPVWVLQNVVLVGDSRTGVIHTTAVDISDRKRAEEQIEYHAYHDVLTGLPNRKLFTDRLRHAIMRGKRTGRVLAVMFIDIDHFKAINDSLGHTAGDELLLEMARRLRACVREDDTVARLGGDEFTIILAELRQPEDAIGVAQKILEAVQVPLNLVGIPTQTTASIGVALYPADGTDPESLLRNADSAMYRAKQAGRNTLHLCTDEMKQRALDRLAIESRLRTAIRDQELILQYQRQISVATGKTIGAEALVRWNDPVRGMMEPSAFLPIAEESRLIIPMGEWVLRTACRQTRQWQDSGAGPMRIAVNLSARQFQHQDLLPMVRSALHDHALHPTSLELEITEATAMHNADSTLETIRALRELGVGIAIDDFGMGYTSLNQLRRFPITRVKIDRVFVNDLAADQGAGVVSAVIGMARSLHLRVVAEGVETAEQFAYLRARDCDEAQGYYFGKPVRADELMRPAVE